MTLSRRARELAAEIRYHDWSDAPFRLDRAGHQREHDRNRGGVPQLTPEQTAAIRTNVMWVTAQWLGYEDPNFDVYEYAEACGVDTRTPSGRPRSGHITAGLRINRETGEYDPPNSRPVTDPTTPGFITGGGEFVHRTEQCRKYRAGILAAEHHGWQVHPPQWITVGIAHAAGRDLCSTCWSE